MTGGLSWRNTPATTSTLFITVIYRGHRQGDLGRYVQQPHGNIITAQRHSQELPSQHSAPWRLLLFLQNAWCAEVPAWFRMVYLFIELVLHGTLYLFVDILEVGLGANFSLSVTFYLH